jgi:hypothetical protein
VEKKMSEQDIIERMDALVCLLLPPFDESKYNLKGIPIQVLKLCDYEHSVNDMINIIKKPRAQIDNALSKLRKEGYIKSISRNGSNVYLRLK